MDVNCLVKKWATSGAQHAFSSAGVVQSARPGSVTDDYVRRSRNPGRGPKILRIGEPHLELPATCSAFP
eukprot:6034313-Pleurochrysis_carterae.AAC.1